MNDQPAILGGVPAFSEMLPIAQPTLPAFDEDFQRDLEGIFSSGMLTKGSYLRQLESELADYLQVGHALAVSSCTMGLLLACHGLGLSGEAIVPSFTFMATVHPLMWLGVKPVFVDIEGESWNLDPERVEEAITPRTSAVIAVHNFGNPAAIDELSEIAAKHNLKLIFDAAHGFGSSYRGQPLGGFGDVGVFSMSPTKLVVAGEGGVVTTNDDHLAEHIRLGREYGNPGDYGSEFPGLNARLPEVNARLALGSLRMLEENANRRNEIVAEYRRGLKQVAGISFQAIHPEGRSSYKDLSIVVHEKEFGLSRDELGQALRAENIDTRRYHDPPVHTHNAYQAEGVARTESLPVTDYISPRSLSLPIWSHMTLETASRVSQAMASIHDHQEQVAEAMRESVEI